METGWVGMEGLGDLILETIISKLDSRGAASVACVSKKLESVASDENLWRAFCSRDFDLDSPRDPDGNPCPSFKVSYKAWEESFGMYPLPLVKRVKRLWDAMRNWMSVNFSEANKTLRKGASEAELKIVEENLGVKLPTAARVLYRFCDGQDTVAHATAKPRLLALGIIGGYKFYDHLVNVHLLPLRQMVEETRGFTRQIGFSVRSKYIIVAASYYSEKWFFLNCANGQLYVGTSNLLSDREMMPCVPQALLRPWPDVNHGVPQDALLLWLEEHCRRLQSGMIRTRVLRELQTVSLYPEVPPACSIAVTNGVQVRASAVFVPEMSDLSGGEEKYYYYSYSVRLSLLPDGCMLDGTYYSSCQLYSRHWIIRSKDVVVSDVSGEAVIGKHPILLPNIEEFVYESCTPLPDAPGSVEGSFTFVPGSLRKPEGRQFDVKVALFPLESPEYIF